jgi:hypothetical protein
MLFCNIIFEWFLAKNNIYGSAVAFRLLKIITFRDEGQAPYQPSDFFVLHFVQLMARLRVFLDQLQLTVPPHKGGVSSSTACSVAVSSRRTNQNFRLLT